MTPTEQSNGRRTHGDPRPNPDPPKTAAPYWRIRHNFGKYFYSLLDFLGDKYRLGYDESINILFFLVAFTFTTGWVLMEVWGAHFREWLPAWLPEWIPVWIPWKFTISMLFAGHLLYGIGLVFYYILPRFEHSKLSKEELKSKARKLWRLIVAGYVCALILEIVTLLHILVKGYRHYDMEVYGPEIVTGICFVMLAYLFGVFLAYRKYSAYKLEGYLGPFELVLWSVLIFFTGGAKSHFFYLYYLTLVPPLSRGLPDEEKLREAFARDRDARKRSWLEKHRFTWVVWPLYPFIWLVAVQLLTVFLSFTITHKRTFMEELGQTYLNTAPWLLLLGIMAIMSELDTDSRQAVSDLMKEKAREDWSKYESKEEGLPGVVAELGLKINQNYFFRCSGILAFSLDTAKSVSGSETKIEAYQLDGIAGLTGKSLAEVRVKVKPASIEPRPEANFAFIFKLFSLYQEGTPQESDIATEYFYYLKERGDRERYEEFRAPIFGEFGYKGDFFEEKTVSSLCSIILSHPSPGGGDEKSFTLVFFKSDLPGEFDDTVTKLYEMLFTQIVGIFKKYELYVIGERAAADERARTKAASGLMHNVKNLIEPALSSSQAAREKFKKFDSRLFTFKKPGSAEEFEDFWEAYVDARQSAQATLDALRGAFDREGAPADLVQETLNAYFEYLRSRDAGSLRTKQLGDIGTQVLECLSSSWRSSKSWIITDEDRPNKLTDDNEWDERQSRLSQTRLNSRPLSKGSFLMWDRRGQKGVMQVRIPASLAAAKVPAGIIVQHILYEVAWNSVKFGGAENILNDKWQDFRVRLTCVRNQSTLRIRVSQGLCARSPKIQKVLDLLNSEGSETMEARGLVGVRYLADRYGWELKAQFGGGNDGCLKHGSPYQKLKVTLCIPLAEV